MEKGHKLYSRRIFCRKGLGAIALGMLAKRGLALPYGVGIPVGRGEASPPPGGSCSESGALPLSESMPFGRVPLHPASVTVDGLPFAPWWTGDDFENESIPFHSCENCFPDGTPPAPTDEVDIVVVGGGISGLATGYLLRRHRPVIFELRHRFGGAAQGESWAGTQYSLGNAYIITPDEGTFLHRLYRQLGLHRAVRTYDGDDPVEIGGQILDDFWHGEGVPPEEHAALARWAEVVGFMAEERYPEIPLPDGKDVQWIIDLDQRSLKQDIEQQMGMEVTPLLAGAIQAYCYSSFNASWDEISAAGGWNFVAAEEFGRWVFPGGNAYISYRLWDKLKKLEAAHSAGARPCHLRGGCRVVDVRLAAGDRVQVTYRDSDGAYRSMLARRVVMCCSKHVCKYMLHELETRDAAKLEAMNRLSYNAYVVVNVLLNAPIERDFYDVFLLGDGSFPMTPGEFEASSRVVDMLSGHYARRLPLPRSVLTLYWPLPFPTSRFTLITDESWQHYAESLVPQIKSMLQLLDVNPGKVRQIRMTRWGHAMPVNAVGLIADGTVDHLRRPFEGKVFFVNQDNWALPAVENCLLDAEIFARQVVEGL